MRINNVQRNQLSSFKARLEVDIPEYVQFLNKIKLNRDSSVCDCAQEAIDAVDLLRKVVPVIGDNSNVVAIKSSNFMGTDGALELYYDNVPLSGLMFPHDNIKQEISSFISKITNGALGDEDLFPRLGEYWNRFFSMPNAKREYKRSLMGGHPFGIIREETVTPDEMIERIMQLDTIV